VRARPGSSDPRRPTADEVRRSPGDAVAGLMVVGFPGTAPKGTFFSRLAARPYGGVLLGRSNYVEAFAAGKARRRVQSVASDAGHAAPIVATQQEGARTSAPFRTSSPRPRSPSGGRRPAAIRGGARFAGQQLKALGIGLNLAPNADVAVAAGPPRGAPTPATRAASRPTSRPPSRATRRRASQRPPARSRATAARRRTVQGPASVGLALEQLRVGDMAPFAAVAKGAGARSGLIVPPRPACAMAR